MTTLPLAVFRPDPTTAAAYAARQAPEVRRREAVGAARDADPDALWGVTLAFHLLQGGGAGSAGTLRIYQSGIRAFVAWAGERGVSLLRPAPSTGRLYVADLQAQGVSPATIRVRVAAARKLYDALRDVEATHADPFAGVKLPKDPTAPIVKRPPYQRGTVEAMLEVADPTAAALLLLCAHAGLRVREALLLTWETVDLTRRLARVKGKGGKERVVPLSPALCERLQALPRSGGPFVLPYSGARAYSTAYEHLERVAEAAGVEWRGFHGARKHAGTALYAQGIPLDRISVFLGHASTETTRAYVAIPDTDLQGAVDALWG